MRRFWIFFLLLGMVSAVPVFAQKTKENQTPFGRKKKEKKNQKVFSKRGGGMFHHKKTGQGNANQFAGNRISGKKSFWASIFGTRSSNNASLRKTKPAKKGDDHALFKRNRTNGKRNHANKQTKNNRKREKTRRRGNDVFSRKKR